MGGSKRADRISSEDAAWLSEHCPYELVTMRLALTMMLRGEQALYNVAYAAFSVHARNLLDFLTDKGDQNSFLASDFVDDWKKISKSEFEQILQSFGSQVFHSSRLRERKPKLVIDQCVRFACVIENQMERFLSALDKQDREIWATKCFVPDELDARKVASGLGGVVVYSATTRPTASNVVDAVTVQSRTPQVD